MTTHNLPKELTQIITGHSYSLDSVGMSGSQVLLFDNMALKIRQTSAEADSEYVIMDWLQGKVPVPQCLYHAVEDGMDYLLMTRISGEMSCDDVFMQEPEWLTQFLAESMRVLWRVDVSGCPVSWDLDHKLAQARLRVERGEVDVEDAEPETFGPDGFESPACLLRWLEENRPEEKLVLSHGDFCLPNIFIRDRALSGFIDLGRAGKADQWQDIALCWRSLKHNFGGVYNGKVYRNYDPGALFEALSMEPDWEKLRYYLLLDELF